MKKMYEKAGITLVALVVTIVILLIISAVTINLVIDEDLFTTTKDTFNAANQSITDTQNKTNELISEWNYISSGIKGGTTDPELDRSILSVGDYVDYQPDTAADYAYPLSEEVTGSSSNGSTYPQETTALKWRIMSINEDGSVDLISATPTSTNLYFEGALGYNNGVYVLNDLCKMMYSNSTLGVTARSIDLVDIESKMNATGIAARNAYTSDASIKYGTGNKDYEGDYSYVPDAWDATATTAEAESTDIYTVPTTNTYEQKGSITVTQTHYNVTFDSTHFDDTNFYNLIFDTGSNCWLASRFTNCYSTNIGFGLHRVRRSNLGGSNMFYSDNNTNGNNFLVRPVVTLGSNIRISVEGGSADNPRTIGL